MVETSRLDGKESHDQSIYPLFCELGYDQGDFVLIFRVSTYCSILLTCFTVDADTLSAVLDHFMSFRENFMKIYRKLWYWLKRGKDQQQPSRCNDFHVLVFTHFSTHIFAFFCTVTTANYLLFILIYSINGLDFTKRAKKEIGPVFMEGKFQNFWKKKWRWVWTWMKNQQDDATFCVSEMFTLNLKINFGWNLKLEPVTGSVFYQGI